MKTVGNFFPGMEEVSRQNLAMMERAMSLFSPFYRPARSEAAAVAASEPGESAELLALRAEVAALRTALNEISHNAAKTNATTTPVDAK